MILLTGKALEERIRGIQINPYIRYPIGLDNRHYRFIKGFYEYTPVIITKILKLLYILCYFIGILEMEMLESTWMGELQGVLPLNPIYIL